MKIGQKYTSLLIGVLAVLLSSLSMTGFSKNLVQDDPVLVPDVAPVPVIDGVGDDGCWQDVPWQSIDQVWIPYGDTVDPEDYSGRYKVVWSSAENLLYFLVEITDDLFVDGYRVGQTAGVYNFDIIEVFIDEDTSGGFHSSLQSGPGTNDENAFGYHIYADFPQVDGVNTDFRVEDMAGDGWPVESVDYAGHFPGFALRMNLDKAVWEFSLIVYNDTYNYKNNVDAARVQLESGKTIGLSLAYCENDDYDENPAERDNFFGSVWVPAAAYNDHWWNADYFGRIQLVDQIPSAVKAKKPIQQRLNLQPNPASSHVQLGMENGYRGEVSISLFNVLGQEVLHTTALKTGPLFEQTLSVRQLPRGIYFVKTQAGDLSFRQKLILRK